MARSQKQIDRENERKAAEQKSSRSYKRIVMEEASKRAEAEKEKYIKQLEKEVDDAGRKCTIYKNFDDTTIYKNYFHVTF